MPDNEMPLRIRRLIDRCVINEREFDNTDMSDALHFASTLWRRLTRMAEHYERQSGNFMPGDIRANCMADAAKDMRHVLSDTRKDCGE